MNSSKITSLLARIPERTARFASGTRFAPGGAACAHPERIALVSRSLHWMTPLDTLPSDDQRALGLHSSGAKPADAADDADMEMEEPVA